ncbi:MAG: acyltransferase family protein [Solirubrobacteraceae bacterium]
MQAPDVSRTPDASHTKHDRRMASLDGLRGLAALSIFLFHVWLYTMPAPVASDRSTFGDYAAHELRLGVVVFFVLSGFLLSRPWFGAALDGRRPPDLRRFVRARVVRIAPAYYVALIGSIALLWGLAGTPGLRLPPAHELPLFFGFAQNLSPGTVLKLNPPMWSLAVEVTFYALLPLVGWLAVRLPPRRRAQALVPLALIALGLLFNWAIAGRGLGMTFSKSLPAMVPYFALGMLAAIALNRRTVGAGARRGLIAGGLVLVAADAALKSAVPAGVGGLPATELAHSFVIFRDLPAAAGFALLVTGLAAAPRSPILGGRIMRGLGAISYPLYLWHVPVLLALRGHGLLPLDPLLALLVATGPVVAISTVSWIVVEQPFLRWSAQRDERKRAAASGRGGVDRHAGRAEVGAVRA